MSEVVNIDDRMLPRRKPKGLIPSTWLGRGVNVEYAAADGSAATITGTLVELYPVGVVLSTDSGLSLLSWDRAILIELQEG